MSKIKIHLDLPQGELPQREKRLRKTYFWVFMDKEGQSLSSFLLWDSESGIEENQDPG
jgi:hypothetical protein